MMFVLQPVLHGTTFKVPIGVRERFSQIGEWIAQEECYNWKDEMIKKLQDGIK